MNGILKTIPIAVGNFIQLDWTKRNRSTQNPAKRKMTKLIAYCGTVSAILLAACQTQDSVGPQKEGPKSSQPEPDWINWPLQKDAVFDPARVNTSSAPIVFSDDTVPASSPTPSYDTKALPKTAATWTQITEGNANDVAIGWYYYFIDKTTQKLKRGEFYNNKWTWTIIPGPLDKDKKEMAFKRVAAAKKESGSWEDYVVAIASDGCAYQLGSSDTWAYMNGSGNGVDIAVSSKGAVEYIGYNYTLYYWNKGNASWGAAVGQAGLRLALSTTGETYLNSTANNLWLVWYDAATGTYKSKFMNAWTVNDVGSAGTVGNPVMHSGSGYSYRLSTVNPFGWTAIGGDYNTRNISCAINNDDASKTTEFQTNNNGNMFYTTYTTY